MKKSQTKTPSYQLSIDSEWTSDHIMITCQIVLYGQIYIYYNKTFENIQKLIDMQLEKYKNILFIPWDIETKKHIFEDLMFRFQKIIPDKKVKFELHFFYSICDLYHLYEQEYILGMVKKNPGGKNTIYQTRNLKGNIEYEMNDFQYLITLFDLKGLSTGSLNKLLNSLGLEHTTKENETIKKYKATMEKCFETIENTETFLDYAIEDVELLKRCKPLFQKNLNQIIVDTLKLNPKYQFNEFTLSSTVGANVAKLIKNFLYNKFEMNGGNDVRLKKLDKEISLSRNIGSKKKTKSGLSSIKNGASVKSLLYLYKNYTGLFNCLVQGGRTINEIPDECFKKNVADIDISGCYGSALKEFILPIGLPRVFSYQNTKKNVITLREFRKEYKDELVPNLYQIIISGKLSFDQSLLYSKLITQSMIDKKALLDIDMTETGSENINGDFVLQPRELKNTVITSDLLDALEKMCRPNEWNEILNCEVVTAAYYPKSKECHTIEDFLDQIEKSPKEIEIQKNDEDHDVCDRRSRAWLGIPLKELIEPLIQERSKIKALLKTNISAEEKLILKAQSESIKRIINTTYGILCSPLFDIGNVIVANNITARARLGIWMVSRSLLGIQTITDGCTYQPDHVLEFKKTVDKKPSLATLSFYDKLKTHRSINTTKLAGIDWKEVFEENRRSENVVEDLPLHRHFGKLDVYATEHIKSFWSIYKLKLPYELEHKIENTASEIFYCKKAHYALKPLSVIRSTDDGALITPEKELLYKFRGLNEGVTEEDDPIMMKIARAFINHDNEMKLDSLQYEESGIYTVYDYLVNNKKREFFKEKQGVIPGFNYKNTKQYKNYYNDFICKDQKTYNQIKKLNLEDSMNIINPNFNVRHNYLLSLANKNYIKDKINNDSIKFNQVIKKYQKQKTKPINNILEDLKLNEFNMFDDQNLINQTLLQMDEAL